MKNSETVNCKKCNESFLATTAEKTGGVCQKCKRGIWDKDDGVLEKMEAGLRLTFGIIFSIVFAGLGYGLGAEVWAGIGLILGGIGLIIGFIYGIFMVEINFFIRVIFKAILRNSIGGE